MRLLPTIPIMLACSALGQAIKPDTLYIEHTVILRFRPSDTNALYSVVWCDDLERGVWSNTWLYDNKPSTTNVMLYSEPVPSPMHKYYRLRIEPISVRYSDIVPSTNEVISIAPIATSTNISTAPIVPPPPTKPQ